jgi:two-component sensor histidine kinase
MASPGALLAGGGVPRATLPTTARCPGSAPGRPVLDRIWRTLGDDPRAARALAIQRDPAAPDDAALTVAVRRRVTALGILQTQMLASTAGEWLDLASCVRALCDAERLAVPDAAGVVLYVDLRPVRVRAETAIVVGLAFCELLRNALAHAFPPGGTGHVGIHLWPTIGLPGVRACLLVADDGRGFGDEPPATAERGISLARQLVVRCSGALVREFGGRGTVWRATLPQLTGAFP